MPTIVPCCSQYLSSKKIRPKISGLFKIEAILLKPRKMQLPQLQQQAAASLPTVRVNPLGDTMASAWAGGNFDGHPVLCCSQHWILTRSSRLTLGDLFRKIEREKEKERVRVSVCETQSGCAFVQERECVSVSVLEIE